MNVDDVEEQLPHYEVRKAFIGFVSLLSSGVVSAIGFMLIASQRWALFDQHIAAFIILFVQWQTLGLTISKVGIDNVVFAVVSQDAHKYFDPRQFIFRKALILAGLFSCVVMFVFSPWAALISLCSILLDTYSLIIMADLNARRFYKITSIANLLNYPLFFLILFCLHYLGALNLNNALAAFLFSSLLRWLWLARRMPPPDNMEEVRCNVSLEMGAQQVLNYLLFRSDQLILSLFLLTTLAKGEISLYVYMAKFPEIVSGLMVLAGTIFFPKMYIQYPFNAATMLREMKKYRLFIVGYCVLFGAGIYMYRKLWNGMPFPAYKMLPFLFHAMLVIFINNVTYSMLRQGYVPKLLLNLIFSVGVGLLFSFTLIKDMNIYALSWLVPIQLLSFLMLSLNSKWGKRVELHA